MYMSCFVRFLEVVVSDAFHLLSGPSVFIPFFYYCLLICFVDKTVLRSVVKLQLTPFMYDSLKMLYFCSANKNLALLLKLL